MQYRFFLILTVSALFLAGCSHSSAIKEPVNDTSLLTTTPIIKQDYSEPSSRSAEEWFQIGNEYVDNNASSMAIEAYHRALQLDRTHKGAWHNLGLLYLQRANVSFEHLLGKRLEPKINTSPLATTEQIEKSAPMEHSNPKQTTATQLVASQPQKTTVTTQAKPVKNASQQQTTATQVVASQPQKSTATTQAKPVKSSSNPKQTTATQVVASQPQKSTAATQAKPVENTASQQQTTATQVAASQPQKSTAATQAKPVKSSSNPKQNTATQVVASQPQKSTVAAQAKPVKSSSNPKQTTATQVVASQPQKTTVTTQTNPVEHSPTAENQRLDEDNTPEREEVKQASLETNTINNEPSYDSHNIKSLTAEIDRKLESRAKRPKRKFVSGSTKDVNYVSYVKNWRSKIEQVGKQNYPKEARRQKLSGKLIMDVALYANGNIAHIKIRKSSGQKLLDNAAIQIIEQAAPFAEFPDPIKADADILHITRTWEFANNKDFR